VKGSYAEKPKNDKYFALGDHRIAVNEENVSLMSKLWNNC